MEMRNAPTSPDLNLNEIDNIPLNCQVFTPFCISWSQDDKISVIVEGGVYLLELWPTPLSVHQTVSFIKSWIPVSASVPLRDVVDNKNGAFLWSLNKRDLSATILDSTLACTVQKSCSIYEVAHIIQCEFSPLIGSRCYLSCLTNYGLLEVYKNSFNKWFPIINVTDLWMTYYNDNTSSAKMGFKQFQNKMFALKIKFMKWCEKPEVLFITCHENGTICLWNVKQLSETLAMNVRHCFQVKGKPCCLELSSLPNFGYSVVLIGALSGNVNCVTIDLSKGETHQNFKIWNKRDLFTPNSIKTQCSDKKLLVFTAKRHILLIQSLSISGLNQLEILQTNWQEFPCTIVSLTEHLNMFVLCLQNHDSYILACENNTSFSSVHKIDTKVKAKQKKSHHCYGLAMSQNKAIWILVSTPRVNYDNLKEITQLAIYSTEMKVYKSLTDVSSSALIEKICREFNKTKLSDILDLMELKKLELLSDSTKFKDCSGMNINSSLLDLKLMLWEAKLKMLSSSSEPDSTVTHLEYLIAQKHAEEMVRKLGELETLSELHKRSFSISKAFLEGEKEKGESTFGTCRICKSETKIENVRLSSCSNSHTFPRCCLSLLPCDVAPYAFCRNCDSVALYRFVSEIEDRCPYCDGLLALDSKGCCRKEIGIKKCDCTTFCSIRRDDDGDINKLRMKRNKANARERNRMHGLNNALDRLRSRLPVKTYRSGISAHHKLSKIETLKIACNYIRILTHILKNNEVIGLPYFVTCLAAGLSQPTSSIIATSLGYRPVFRKLRQCFSKNAQHFEIVDFFPIS